MGVSGLQDGFSVDPGRPHGALCASAGIAFGTPDIGGGGWTSMRSSCSIGWRSRWGRWRSVVVPMRLSQPCEWCVLLLLLLCPVFLTRVMTRKKGKKCNRGRLRHRGSQKATARRRLQGGERLCKALRGPLARRPVRRVLHGHSPWGAAHCIVCLACFGVRACVLSFVLNPQVPLAQPHLPPPPDPWPPEGQLVKEKKGAEAPRRGEPHR